MTKQYVAKNGKVFETEEQCLTYEAELEAEEQRKIQLEKEKELRLKEIEQLYNDFIKKVLIYQNDYHQIVVLRGNRIDNLFDTFLLDF